MIYSKTLTSICNEVFTEERLKELHRDEKKKVVTTILGYILGVFNYQEFTPLSFLSSSERKNIRLALNKHCRKMFLLKMATVYCLKHKVVSPYAMKNIFISYGLHASDHMLVIKLSDMKIKTKAIAIARKCDRSLDVKVADRCLNEIIGDIRKPLGRAVEKKLNYVYVSQGYGSADFTSTLIERSIMAFYKYYPMCSQTSLLKQMAKAGHNYLENIRVKYGAEDRSRLVKGIADTKDSEYTGKGSNKVSLYNTTSLDSVVSSDGGDVSLGAFIPDSKSDEAISNFFETKSFDTFRDSLAGTKLSIFNILTLNYNSEFLAYCHKELGISADDVSSVLDSSMGEDSMFFVELVRKFHNVSYSKYYVFIREISLALGLPYEWEVKTENTMVSLKDLKNVA